MNRFLIIFRFEGRLLLRTPAMLVSLLVFTLIGCYALFSGSATIKRQQAAIDSLHADYQHKYERVLARFHPADTSAAAKRDSTYAGMAVMVNYWLPQVAANTPSAVAFMAVGQRDVYPYFVQVRSSVDYLDASNAQLANPVKQLAGHLDFAFVITYLLPLLCIGMCYNALAQEKTAGTHSLLRLYGLGDAQLARFKLLARYSFAAAMLVILHLLALSMAGLGAIVAVGSFLGLSLLYLLFWMAAFYAIVCLANEAMATALAMLAAWVAFVVVMPALSNTALDVRHPVPLKADIASYKRHASETIWATDQDTLVRQFLDNNVEFRPYYRPELDERPWGDWAIAAYYDLLDRQVTAYADTALQPLERRTAASQQLVRYNPVTLVQALYTELAGTSLRQQEFFEEQAAAFQRTWRRFIYRFQLTGTSLVPDDFQTFPRFEPVPYRRHQQLFAWGAIAWAAYICLFLLLPHGWRSRRADR
ncbi:DUF3526 domain-containing protein [Parapedobacter koreensis]|uniref:ABC-2 type transport system permease protein n=1 Tax=Parapedobacter koreensis TaxID=332977 RepID=A0A1H7Q4C1_9SPHI|nr:DUF3526 domain-containing protein [Parapedobacter koreensis]SEL42147.1 protein of unknown function [Parapedobacter koreensis]